MKESQILVTKPNDSTLNLKGSQKKYNQSYVNIIMIINKLY